MEEIAGWIAPIATTVAAMMTASNLGPRVTGWGFAVFVIASLAWIVVALATGQINLLLANGFLTLVNIVGVWRWLGREARWGQGANAAEQDSKPGPTPTLFPVSAIADAPVRGRGGEIVAHGVDAMAERGSGAITYLMVREGGTVGVGARLHALDWAHLRRCEDGFETDLDSAAVATLPEAEATRWPTEPQR